MKKVFLCSLLAAMLLSCNDETTVPTIGSAVQYVNTIPVDTANLDVFNNQILIDTGLIFGDNTPYYLAEPGTNNVSFNNHSNNAQVASIITDFASNTFYSVFAIQDGSTNAAVIVQDRIFVPSLDSCFVRFLHFSPDAGGVDVAITGGETLFLSRTYNDQESNSTKSEFTRLLAGTYDLEVRPIGSGTALLSLPGTVLEGGKVYTIYARGLVAGTSPYNLGAGIIVNYP